MRRGCWECLEWIHKRADKIEQKPIKRIERKRGKNEKQHF